MEVIIVGSKKMSKEKVKKEAQRREKKDKRANKSD
jgi:hypothetical protein